MPRKAREKSASKIYHVYNHAIDEHKIFKTDRQKNFFKICIREYLQKYQICIYAYCIMNNHMHFLIEGELEELSGFMRDLQGKYAFTYNQYHGRQGHVFRNAFKSKAVLEERYFWGLMRYIHLNPVKANIVGEASEYNYSSFLEYKSYNSEKSIISEKARISIQKYYPNFSDFEKFHGIKDLVIYEDVIPEMKIQISEKKETAKKFINEYLENTTNIDAIIEVVKILYDEYKFTKGQISELLNISVYKINIYLEYKKI